ncbi:hypothetical protein RIF29_21324 [Crotalaria pallida]|uniref:ADP-ribosyl cyclase/cyclic ADP-ribose hydrolase n=1 Tax=Crotalaria pallida TaxID=3830 RepID=A0AAN9F2J9_CROPI
MATPTSSTSSSSPSATSTFTHTYDVFISSRGYSDAIKRFIIKLRDAVHEKGFKTFLHDGHLKKASELSADLLKAIQESRIVIVVLSKNVAKKLQPSSNFGLDEITKIMKSSPSLAIPFVYNADGDGMIDFHRSVATG